MPYVDDNVNLRYDTVANRKIFFNYLLTVLVPSHVIEHARTNIDLKFITAEIKNI